MVMSSTRRMRFNSVVVSLLIILGGAGFGEVYAQEAVQPSGLGDRSFERIEGLPHNTVLALLQDRQGFLWVGTSDGLSRYDGYEFLSYHHHPSDSSSLSNNIVSALLEGRDGTLWVGTSEGVDALDRTTGRFRRYHFKEKRLSQSIQTLFEDADGSLWAGTDHGLIHLHPETGHYVYHVQGSPEEPVAFYTIEGCGEGFFCLGTVQPEAGDVYRFNRQTARFTRFAIGQVRNAGSKVAVLQGSDSLWVGTSQGVGSFDMKARRFTHVLDIGGDPILEDREGGIWIDEGTVLVRFDPTTRTTTTYDLDPRGTNTLVRDVRILLEDRTGALWAGTLGGLFRLDLQQKPFTHRRHTLDDPGALSSNVVMAVHEDARGSLWVGTLGGGLNQIDPRSRQTVSYRHDENDPVSLCHDEVWALEQDRAGILWIGTKGGLCRRDPRTGHVEKVEVEDDVGFVYVLAEDTAGNLWVGGRHLDRLDPLTGEQTRYSATAVGEEPLNNFQALYPAPSGEVWVGTEFSGLWRVDPATGVLQPYAKLGRALDFIQHAAVRVIHPGSEPQTLWLGTERGLIYLDVRADTLRHYLQPDGLPGSSVFGILEDRQERLWISTNRGVARFDPDTESFTVYTAADGTGNNEYNRRAAFKSADGTFHFGGLNGLTSFLPEAIGVNPHAPPIVITHVEKAGRKGQVPLLPARVMQDGLVLHPDESALSFTFAALSFINPQKNQYAYRLAGFDEAWVDAGTRRYARYAGLPPGRYVFQVRGANADGVWNEVSTNVNVRVVPAFWQTGWFRLALAALLLGVLYGAYRYRLAHVLREERLRLRIASDLHDEIGSKLSSIALASEMVAARAVLDQREHRQLTEVTRQARRMVDELRDIVWFVNPRHDRLDNLISPNAAGGLLLAQRHALYVQGAGGRTGTGTQHGAPSAPFPDVS